MSVFFVYVGMECLLGFVHFFLGNECLEMYDPRPVLSCLFFFSNTRYVYDLQNSELRTGN